MWPFPGAVARLAAEALAAQKIIVTGQINPCENQGIRGSIGFYLGVLSGGEYADLVCGDVQKTNFEKI
jgi:hypothetical protein